MNTVYQRVLVVLEPFVLCILGCLLEYFVNELLLFKSQSKIQSYRHWTQG